VSNPTRLAFENAMKEIEGGSECMAFASGMQAAVALFMACPQSHIILPDDLYHGVYTALVEIFQLWGISYEKVDMTDHAKVAERLESVKNEISSSKNPDKKLLFWIETPSNPSCKISDISKLSSMVHDRFPRPHQAIVVVDSTWSTPYLTKPLAIGADVVLHSTTKYIGGHSDTLGGCLVLKGQSTSTDQQEEKSDSRTSDRVGNSTDYSLELRLRQVHQIGGGVLSAFDSWLALRGLRTLHVRMRQHCESANIVAEYLTGHKCVQQVHYPGLVSHPQHKIATAQMGGKYYGGMLSFLVKGTSAAIAEANALEVVKQVKLFKRATSLGGTESLMEHRATVEGKFGSSPTNLLRISVGLENVGDLLTDLDIALSKVHK
jgi:cystathionine gamma-synthase